MAAPLGVIPAWLMVVWLAPVQDARVQQSQTATVAVSISPNPTLVGRRTVFIARVTPAPRVPVAYRFYVDDRVVCAQESPECEYVPPAAGTYYVHVQAAARAPSGGRATAPRVLSSTKQRLTVQAPPDKPPVLLSLKLISPRVAAGDNAVFELTVANAVTMPPVAFDPGDGSPRRAVKAGQFTYVYQRAGRMTASVSLPREIVGRGDSVSVAVEAPQRVVVLTLKVASPSIVAGGAASFSVSVEGLAGLPEYLFDPGDGTGPRPRRDATFPYVYANSGSYRAAVSLPPNVMGKGSSVVVDVRAPPQKPPILLSLKLISPRVVAGEAAEFEVTTANALALPPVVFDPGDGSGRTTVQGPRFKHVYQKAGPVIASVGLPRGIVGRGAEEKVNVEAPPRVVALTLKVASPSIVAGGAASFSVSVEGLAGLPEYVFDPGDGTAPRLRREATFPYTYANAGSYRPAVRLPPGVAGKGSSVVVNVTSTRVPLVLLSLKLISPRVVAGDAAVFELTAANAVPVPPVVFDPGDGSARSTVKGGQFKHVYQKAGRMTASVSLPRGVDGRGDSVDVAVEPAPRAVVLTLRVASPSVVAGGAASFSVAVEGLTALPVYMFDPGDGTGPRARREATFPYTYANAGSYRPAVSLPPGVAGKGSSVLVDVTAPQKPLVLLSLRLISPRVVAGEAAVFEVTAANAAALPPVVFDPGDGSPQTGIDRAQFRHVYQKAGRMSASVSLPPGIAGRGASVSVDVEAPPPRAVVLTLNVASPSVVAGNAASFSVTVEGLSALPEYLFDPGDSTGPQVRRDPTFPYVYTNAGSYRAAVSLAAGVVGTGSSVVVDVAPSTSRPPPIALVLQLVTPEVAPGEPARFAVSVIGGGALPQYVLDVGDGSAPQNRGDASFTYVYQQAGQYLASVSLLAGVGTGSTVNVVVRAPDGLSPWVYIGLVLIAIIGAYAAGRAARKPPSPRVVVTLHPRPSLQPAFRPGKPRGVSLDVRFVRNLRRMRFTARVLTGKER
jgi:hypothetical protein